MNKFYVSLMLAINVAGISIAEAGTDLGYSDFAVVIPLMQNEIDNPELFKCSKLIGKYQLPKSVKSQEIVKGDIYEVLLKRVHISDHYRPDFLQFSKGGKIAILANGFEMQSGGNGALGGFDYSRSSAGDSRVIYFSEDVRAGQFLEFGQIIMFGPAEYHGNPLGVSLFGLEVIDKGSTDKASSLFSSLADLGAKFTGPYAPAFSVLNEIGTSIIRSKKDDLLFRYDTSILSNESANPGLRSLFAAYGEYVMIRSQDRVKLIDWSQYRYDAASGVLYTSKDCASGTDYKGTYGVVQINKAPAEAQASYARFRAFHEALDAASQQSAADFKVSMQNVVTHIDEADEYHKIIRSIDAVSKSSKSSQPTLQQEGAFNQALKDIKSSIDINASGTKSIDGKIYLSPELVSTAVAQVQHLNHTADFISVDNFDINLVKKAIEQNWK